MPGTENYIYLRYKTGQKYNNYAAESHFKTKCYSDKNHSKNSISYYSKNCIFGI